MLLLEWIAHQEIQVPCPQRSRKSKITMSMEWRKMNISTQFIGFIWRRKSTACEYRMSQFIEGGMVLYSPLLTISKKVIFYLENCSCCCITSVTLGTRKKIFLWSLFSLSRCSIHIFTATIVLPLPGWKNVPLYTFYVPLYIIYSAITRVINVCVSSVYQR